MKTTAYLQSGTGQKKYKVTIIDTNTPKRKDVKFIKASILNKKIIILLLHYG